MTNRMKEIIEASVFMISRDQFLTSSGKPRVDALSEVLGFSVSAKERDLAFDRINESLIIDEEGGDLESEDEDTRAELPEAPNDPISIWDVLGLRNRKRMPTLQGFRNQALSWWRTGDRLSRYAHSMDVSEDPENDPLARPDFPTLIEQYNKRI